MTPFAPIADAVVFETPVDHTPRPRRLKGHGNHRPLWDLDGTPPSVARALAGARWRARAHEDARRRVRKAHK